MLNMVERTADAEAPDVRRRGRFSPVREQVRSARIWLRHFRRTRPFWGGLWMIAGGWTILHVSRISFAAAFAAGITGFGGWLTGGGLLICGAMAWATPPQRYVSGLLGMLLAIGSLVVSNLGGFFIGMTLGIVGSAMTLSWGAKPRKSPSGRES